MVDRIKSSYRRTSFMADVDTMKEIKINKAVHDFATISEYLIHCHRFFSEYNNGKK